MHLPEVNAPLSYVPLPPIEVSWLLPFGKVVRGFAPTAGFAITP